MPGLIDDNINHEYIIRYLRNTLRKNEGLLFEMEQYAAENDVPISQPESIRLIEVLVRLSGAKNILEVGGAIGYSAICMAKASEGGTVTSLELSSEMIEKANAYITRAGLRERIRFLQGDAKEVLKTLDGQYDLIFLDAAKGHYMEYFTESMRMLKAGGLLISDNVLYKGMVATDELLLHRKRTIVARLRRYLDMLCAHEELETAVLPVGDGVALSVRKGV